MPTKALYVRLKAKAGKEQEVEEFLKQGKSLVDEEPGTLTWYAFKSGSDEYAIFDTFADEDGRQAHLNGKVAQALNEKADDLFEIPPSITEIDIVASK